MTVPRRAVTAWVTYDLANTVFALGVLGLYFPTWLTEEKGFPDSALALAEAGAGLVVVFLAPLVGARTDSSGRRVPSLRTATTVAVGGTLLLGRLPVVWSLVALAVALVGFHVGTAVYDALLPSISSHKNRGRISGLGVAVGYVGSFVGLGIGAMLLGAGAGYETVFAALGLAFLLFALPSWFLIPEPNASMPAEKRRLVAGLVASWRKAAAVPGVRSFLLGRFLYTDAINTLIGGFLVIYVQQELGFTAENSQTLVGTAIAASLVGGLLGGWLTDRFGPKKILLGTLGLWFVTMVTAATVRDTTLAWAVGPLGGIALGSTWASDRVMMAGLSPPQLIGEFYGLYATVGRFAAILGPLAWVFVAETLGFGRRAAVLTLALFIFGSILVIRRVPQIASVSPSVNRSSTS